MTLTILAWIYGIGAVLTYIFTVIVAAKQNDLESVYWRRDNALTVSLRSLGYASIWFLIVFTYLIVLVMSVWEWARK